MKDYEKKRDEHDRAAKLPEATGGAARARLLEWRETVKAVMPAVEWLTAVRPGTPQVYHDAANVFEPMVPAEEYQLTCDAVFQLLQRTNELTGNHWAQDGNPRNTCVALERRFADLHQDLDAARAQLRKWRETVRLLTDRWRRFDNADPGVKYHDIDNAVDALMRLLSATPDDSDATDEHRCWWRGEAERINDAWTTASAELTAAGAPLGTMAERVGWLRRRAEEVRAERDTARAQLLEWRETVGRHSVRLTDACNRAACTDSDNITVPIAAVRDILRPLFAAQDEGWESQQLDNDCLRCAVATVLGVPYGDVPHFTARAGKDCLEDLVMWGAARGLDVEVTDTDPGMRCVAFGDSSRGKRHAVVWHSGLQWDPHPSREGLSGPPEYFAVFADERERLRKRVEQLEADRASLQRQREYYERRCCEKEDVEARLRQRLKEAEESRKSYLEYESREFARRAQAIAARSEASPTRRAALENVADAARLWRERWCREDDGGRNADMTEEADWPALEEALVSALDRLDRAEAPEDEAPEEALVSALDRLDRAEAPEDEAPEGLAIYAVPPKEASSDELAQWFAKRWSSEHPMHWSRKLAGAMRGYADRQLRKAGKGSVDVRRVLMAAERLQKLANDLQQVFS